MRLTWKKDKPDRGLAGIGRGTPKGSTLNSGGVAYAHVDEVGKSIFDRNKVGWYWSAPSNGDIPLKNTYSNPVATEEEAKATAKAYILEYLNKGTK